MKNKNKMKRKSGDYNSSSSSNNNSKKFVSNSHNIGQMNTAAGMAYSQMVQSPYNVTGDYTANNSIHQTYYANYTNLQYIVDPNHYAAYYHPVPPHIASGIYNQPPPPPLPPDDSCMIKPPLPPGMPPPGGMSPPQNNWLRKPNQRTPNVNNKYQKFQKTQSITSVTCKTVACKTDKPSDEITVSKKAKRKPMSTRYTRKKEWDREDAMKAIALENEYNRLQKLPMLILKFPDPDLNKDIVKSFSNQIDNVHFQQPSTARYCYVTLRSDANIKEVEHEIGNISFGTGKVMVKKHNHDERTEVAPEEIDPYTLYIGNLPTNITVGAVKEKFPTAQRIDIGFAQKMKYTRYAFIRYETIEESTEAFRNTFNLEMESRSLIVRFRRQKGNVGLPGETRLPKAKLLAITESAAPVTDLLITPAISLPETSIIEMKKTENVKLKSITENKPEVKTRTETPISQNSPPLKELDDTEKVPEKITNTPPPSSLEPEPPLDSVDSKANVLEEAMKLMSENRSESDNISEEISIISGTEPISSSETEFLSDTVSSIKTETITNNEIYDDFIIGTRVKEEPEDFEDDNEFDEDDSDDEILDDDEEDEEMVDDKEEDDDDAALYDRFNHFDDMEFPHLEGMLVKPKVEEIEVPHDVGTNKDSGDKDDGDLNHRTSQKRSEYDDLFDSLNPNDNLEL